MNVPFYWRWSDIKWFVPGAVIFVLAVLSFLFPVQTRIRDSEGWVRAANSLQNIAIALHTYHDAFGRLPPAVVRDKNGRRLYSWRVLLLPFLEKADLYRQFRLDEPWDSPHNITLLEKMPKCYVPALSGSVESGLTRYQLCVGPGTVFERDGLTLPDITDEHSATILVVEAGEPVPWSKPVDCVYSPDAPLPPLGGVFTKAVRILSYEVQRKSGFVAAFADGKARFIPSDIDEQTIRGFLTRNGGENVDLSKLK